VAYPESAPADWLDRLQLSGTRCAISPLHDRDLDPTGEPKKPHWHVIACWDGPTTYNAAKALADRCGATVPVALSSVRGYYRYLTHADNPEKAQYDSSGIRHLGGFDPADYIELTRSELEKLKRQVMQIIRDADLCEYADLLEMLADSEAFDLLTVAMGHTMLFRGYLQSRKFRGKPEPEREEG